MLITPLTGRLAVVAMLIVLTAMASLARGGAGERTANATSLNQSRTDMIAGCRDQGAPRSYCECVADRVRERDGRNVARLRAMEAEVGRLRPGSPPPRLLVSATRACARA